MGKFNFEVPSIYETWSALLNGETVETEDALRAQLNEIDGCRLTKRAKSRIDAGERKAEMLNDWISSGVSHVHMKGSSFRKGPAK